MDEQLIRLEREAALGDFRAIEALERYRAGGWSYQYLDPFIDYDSYSIHEFDSKWEPHPLMVGLPKSLRGPKPDLGKAHFSCLGAAQTVGRFCQNPYPNLLAKKLNLEVLNLAKGGANPESYIKYHPKRIELTSTAKFTIIQVMAARSISNSFFENSLQLEYMMNDIWKAILGKGQKFIQQLVNEIRANYIDWTKKLLAAIPTPTVLLYFSSRTPEYRVKFDSMSGIYGNFPQLVNRKVMDAIIPAANTYVEVVSNKGLPQKLPQPVPRVMHSGTMAYNTYYPSPEMHILAANALHEVIINKGLHKI